MFESMFFTRRDKARQKDVDGGLKDRAGGEEGVYVTVVSARYLDGRVVDVAF